jgi:hypothetical protein
VEEIFYRVAFFCLHAPISGLFFSPSTSRCGSCALSMVFILRSNVGPEMPFRGLHSGACREGFPNVAKNCTHVQSERANAGHGLGSSG